MALTIFLVLVLAGLIYSLVEILPIPGLPLKKTVLILMIIYDLIMLYFYHVI